jgi:Kef-type K+ transport system membrane component KefB
MHFLEEITILATVSVLVTLILGRVKLPVVAGLLLSGALVGSHGLSLASDMDAIELIADWVSVSEWLDPNFKGKRTA